MKRYEYWRALYQQRRYLKDVNESELSPRAAEIICNVTTLSTEGKIGLVAMEKGGAYWLELFDNVTEEYRLRGSALPADMPDKIGLPNFTWPQARRASALAEADFDPTRHLARLGKGKYTAANLDGIWRLSPASSYTDPSLNFARQDSELERTVYALRDEVVMTKVDKKTGQPAERIYPMGNVAVTYRSAADYYVICFSKSLSLRLFDDFEADSCLIVRDVKEFARRMFSGVRKRLPGFQGWLRDVTYFDPLNPLPSSRDVFFLKHFRYWYQQEVRFIRLPRAPCDLAFENVEVGSLRDICDVLVLPQDSIESNYSSPTLPK
jgi:hypothetical protein